MHRAAGTTVWHRLRATDFPGGGQCSVFISYVTSQPEGQKLMEDEIACDFLPPTTVTMLPSHSMHLHTHSHTHAVTLLREVWEPLPSLNKLPRYARLSKKMWHCFQMLTSAQPRWDKTPMLWVFFLIKISLWAVSVTSVQVYHLYPGLSDAPSPSTALSDTALKWSLISQNNICVGVLGLKSNTVVHSGEKVN